MEGVQSVLPDEEGLETSDYHSEPIFVNSGIPIGARSELTTVLYVRRQWASWSSKGFRGMEARG